MPTTSGSLVCLLCGSRLMEFVSSLHRFYRESISYVEEKNNPAKHIVLGTIKSLIHVLADERCDRMKSRDMSSSETGSEPYQRRVLLFAATRPIVPHPPPRLSRMSRLPLALTSKGGFTMQEAVLSPLATWQTFYVITGSAAATLTGLMFVVITLIAGVRQRRSSESGVAFGTPTVVHFCLALLVAAILSAPWQALWNARLLFPLCTLVGGF